MNKILFVFYLMFSVQNLEAFTLLANVPGWSGKELTIYLNKTNCNADPEPAVKKAIALWNGVSTARLKLKVVVDTTRTLAGFTSFSYAGVGGILCDTSFSGASTTLGLGTYAYSAGTSYGYVRLNASGGTGDFSNFSTTEQATVIAHEIGHMVNLGHTEANDALMYYQLSAKTDLSLSWDDLQGYTYLYPRSEFGDDGFMACGLVKGTSGPGTSQNLLLLLIPLLLYCVLRRRRSFAKVPYLKVQ